MNPTRAPGISDSTPHAPVIISDDYNGYPGTVARAVAMLQSAGIGGPFAIALGPRCYTGVARAKASTSTYRRPRLRPR